MISVTFCLAKSRYFLCYFIVGYNLCVYLFVLFYINNTAKSNTSLTTTVIYSGVSRTSFRREGVQIIFGKVFVRGMLPREDFLKWCNLVGFGEYFDKIL